MTYLSFVSFEVFLVWLIVADIVIQTLSRGMGSLHTSVRLFVSISFTKYTCTPRNPWMAGYCTDDEMKQQMVYVLLRQMMMLLE